MSAGALVALLRLREHLEAEAAASLARSLETVRAVARALASVRADLAVREELGRLREEDLAELAVSARFRQRMRDEAARLSAAEGAHRSCLASAEAAAEGARCGLASARADRRAAQARRELWLAARRAAREEAEERERDDADPRRRDGPGVAGDAHRP